MNEAADRLQRVMEQVGCTVDPHASYNGYAAGNPDRDPDDDALDADFEEL